MPKEYIIDDTIVGIQREEWMRKIGELIQSEPLLEIVVSTHEETDTTIYTEYDGSEIILEGAS
jgi:hypothetical protein